MISHLFNIFSSVGPTVIIFWFIFALLGFIKEKKKNRKVKISTLVNLILASVVLALFLFVIFYFFVIMDNPFAR